MTTAKPTFFATAAAFRAWLHANHAHAAELIVGLHKPESGKTSMTWPESVDQALCYGWLDGVRRSHDAWSYTIRFAPRQARSTWSSESIRRMDELRGVGLMMPAGEAAFARRAEDRPESTAYDQRGSGLDAAAERAMRRQSRAWAFWEAQEPSYQRQAARWVKSATREATRRGRIETLIASCAKSEWIPQMLNAQPADTKAAAKPARGKPAHKKPPRSP